MRFISYCCHGGLSRIGAERIAIHLALTMHLALESPRVSLSELLLPNSHGSIAAIISLPQREFHAIDGVLISILVLMTIVALW